MSELRNRIEREILGETKDNVITEEIMEMVDTLVLEGASAHELGARPETLRAISAEVARSRVKFPADKHNLAALMEEVGELAKAFLKDEGDERVRAEAIQVACAAIRIIEGGDEAFAEKDWGVG